MFPPLLSRHLYTLGSPQEETTATKIYSLLLLMAVLCVDADRTSFGRVNILQKKRIEQQQPTCSQTDYAFKREAERMQRSIIRRTFSYLL